MEKVVNDIVAFLKEQEANLKSGHRVSIDLTQRPKEERQILVRLYGRKYTADVVHSALQRLGWNTQYDVRLKPNKKNPNIVTLCLKPLK